MIAFTDKKIEDLQQEREKERKKKQSWFIERPKKMIQVD